MPLNCRTTGDEGESRAPSRAEIETLCILHAVGAHGCHVADLPARLGLSPALASALAEGIEPLISAGRLDEHEDQLSLTNAGHDWLKQRLSELGVTGDSA